LCVRKEIAAIVLKIVGAITQNLVVLDVCTCLLWFVLWNYSGSSKYVERGSWVMRLGLKMYIFCVCVCVRARVHAQTCMLIVWAEVYLLSSY